MGPLLPFGSKYGGPWPLFAFYIPSNILGRPLDRRIGAAFSLRSKYGGRRRSAHLGLHTRHELTFRSARSTMIANHNMLLRLLLSLPAARSANRGRVLASLEIWRPSPIFALRLEYRTSIEISLRFL